MQRLPGDLRRQGTHRGRPRHPPETLPNARRPARAHLGRRRLLSPLPRGLPQSPRAALPPQHGHRVRLSLRLRHLPRPRAARLRLRLGDHRPLQPELPHVFRAERSAPRDASLDGADRVDARLHRAQRKGARRAPGVRRRAHRAPAVLRRARRVPQAPHPPSDGEHQRHSHRQRPRVRRAPRDLYAALRAVLPVRRPRRRRHPRASRRAPLRHQRSRTQSARRARRLHHSGRHPQARPERSHDR